MSREQEKQIANLRQLFEQGLLDEATYNAAVEGISKSVSQTAAAGEGSAVAQDHSTAVAAGGVNIPGTVVGNVYVGDPTDDPQEALRIYRQVLLDSSANLPLRGVDVGASDPATARQLDLANVYVDLDTTSRFIVAAGEEFSPMPKRQAAARDERDRPLTALEATIDNRWLVLTGEPGGGKSTFVNHLAFCLAAHALEPYAGWLDHLPEWPAQEVNPLPIVITLRDFAATLDESKIGPVKLKDLWQFFVGSLDDKNLGFAVRAIERELRNGRAIVFFDGLDEVPGTSRRVIVRDAVAAFAANYPGNRFLVTCRILSYQPPQASDDENDEVEPDLRLDEQNFPVYEIALFDEAKIDRFIGAWYAELARIGSVPSQDTHRLSERLKEAVRRQDLWRLAPNPLLLTVMSLVHAHEGRLPDARALLYERTVDMLLWRWEEVKTSGGIQMPTLRQLLLDAGRADLDLKRLLWRLAYAAHGRSPDDDEQEELGDITESQLTRALERLKREDWGWSHAMVEAMKLRAGILVERLPGVFTFPHRTFQEYLAGAHLSTQKDFSVQAAGLGALGALWREPILLAAGRLVHVAGDVDKALWMVNRLCPLQEPETEGGWRNVWLAADALREIGLRRTLDDELGGELLERVRQRLAQLVTGGHLAPRERAAAGETLAELGDPRREVTEIDSMRFCLVPAGQFWMGSAEEDEDAREDEKPQHKLDVPYDYWIGRYPVSNAQYATFVKDDGYLVAAYWPEAIREKFWQAEKGIKGYLDSDFRRGPVDIGRPFNLDNHPVVGISWYEALAFTRWLMERWRADGRLPDHLQVALPSEAEWEKAARGGLQIPVQADSLTAGRWERPGQLIDNPLDIRRYPWGDDIDPNLANGDDSGIGSTSALGVFSRQKNPYGAQEMSGNVWEWTRSLFGHWDSNKAEHVELFQYRYEHGDGREDLNKSDDWSRILRGGAYYNGSDWLRCAYRNRNYPNSRYNYIGFRLVVSPLPTSDL